MSNTSRINSLDSLRGLASLSVVIHHTMLTAPIFYLAHYHDINNTFVRVITDSPLHIFWAGHEAVLLFFVLSGFVLSLPFLNNRQLSYSRYLTRRLSRIYLPYILSIALSAALLRIISPSEPEGTSAMFSSMWSHSVSIGATVSYVFMLGYDLLNLNGVTWSLVHEMRISAFFPLLMYFVIRWHWKRTMSIGIVCSLSLWCVFVLLSKFVGNGTMRYVLTSFADTFYYTCFFIVGAVTAKYRDFLVEKAKKLSNVYKVAMLVCFLLLYNVEWTSFGFGDLKYMDTIIPNKLIAVFIDFIIALSVVLLFMLVLSTTKLQNILNNRILLKLGKVSYSLYLTHMIVLSTMVYTLSAFLPLAWILGFSPIICLIFAIVYYCLIERTSINLGKQITSAQLFDRKSIRNATR